jgi:hypothetical protein
MIDELHYCAAQCSRCLDACRMERNPGELQRCMMMDEDCAALCRLTSQLLERNSENAELFLKLCAEICNRCAEECEKHSQFEHCTRCAEACRKCAEMCHHQTAH